MYMGQLVELWKDQVKRVKVETYALYLAYKDPRVPWYAKVFTAMIVGYAFSPIDLIPDFLPIIGYLDDFIIIPLGVLFALKMIPEPVMAEYRVKAVEKMSQEGYQNWVAGVVIIIVWILVLVLIFLMVKKYLPAEIFGLWPC
jgi:uncharacterized membrane protein YkvA (DUF1232 family)